MLIPQFESAAEELVTRTAPLAARATQYCYNRYNQRYRCKTSAWSRFGRWVLVGILILAALFLVMVLACVMMRRRRRAAKNSTPMTNTGAGYNNAPAYGGQQYAAPSGPPPQQYGGGNEGYYGQQNGVTQPQGAYVK